MMGIEPPVKIGVVGCGSIARGLHLPVIAGLRDYLQLVAVCDVNENAARETGEAYRVPHFTSFERMLEADVEAVSVLTHAYNHHLLGAMAARAGKHVIVEKPIAITLPCADYLIEACREAGVVLEVTENYPFMPDDALVNRVARSGAIGDVVAVFVCDDINGISIDIGVHRFAQLRGPVASRPVRISAEVRRPQFGRPEAEVTDRSFGDPFGDYWGRATVEFEDGALGLCECFPLARAAPVWANDYRRVIGTKGVITDDLWPNIFPRLPEGCLSVDLWPGSNPGEWERIPVQRVVREAPGGPVLESMTAHVSPAITWENRFRDCPFGVEGLKEVEAVEWASPASLQMWLIAEAELYAGFASAVRTGEPPRYGAENGRLDLEMCIATYHSAEAGQPVALPLRKITQHEERVHEDFRARFGRDPLPIG